MTAEESATAAGEGFADTLFEPSMPTPDLPRVSPAEARALCDQGATYVDVRSEPEYADGHPTGAINVPFLHKGPTGLTPNPDFLPVMEATFPKDRALVIGCKSGGRSLQAATALLQAGYKNVTDQRAGFDGVRDAFGALTEPGWKPAGLPVTTGDDAATYRELAGRAAR